MDTRTQQGFTLIELIVVVVILGILAAVAIPKYVNLSNNAGQAAVSAIAGALSAASATNYGTRSASPTQGTAIANCQTVGSLLPGAVTVAGSSPAYMMLPGYTITSLAITAGNDVTCTVTRTSGGKQPRLPPLGSVRL